MACYATSALTTRIEEDLEGSKIQKIASKATILYKKDKHLYPLRKLKVGITRCNE
ncbi:hypothetical protein OSCI_10009 [Kamptonema sp. PCC 6506]|nr:hypothetical protein OSCI_10009 [Kamptonema sp. PCC 6506]